MPVMWTSAHQGGMITALHPGLAASGLQAVATLSTNLKGAGPTHALEPGCPRQSRAASFQVCVSVPVTNGPDTFKYRPSDRSFVQTSVAPFTAQLPALPAIHSSASCQRLPLRAGHRQRADAVDSCCHFKASGPRQVAQQQVGCQHVQTLHTHHHNKPGSTQHGG